MGLYAIADYHLSESVDKPMDIFGGAWENYTEKIKAGLQETMKSDDDVLIVGGDFSWGIDLKEALADFRLLASYPGQKILLKGNHDLWWDTLTKLTRILAENGLFHISFLFNNCYVYKDIALCGTRGWFFEEERSDSHDEKVFRRELLRLEASLNAARQTAAERIYCFLHYPPLYQGYRCDEILDIMKRYGVARCYYGHLHSHSQRLAVQGVQEGIDFRLIAADYMNFRPALIEE